MRRFALVLFGVTVAALFTALPVSAKEDVKATLTQGVPLDAPAGTQLTVSWTLFYVDENGRRQPFGANGVFVRLLSASGAASTEGVAPVGSHDTGEYEATVLVPEGGIRDIELGLAGWVSDTEGTRRSDLIFPITNDPVRRAAPIVSPGPAESAPGSSDAVRTWVLAAIASLLCALGLLASVLVLRGRRGRRDAPPRGQVARG